MLSLIHVSPQLHLLKCKNREIVICFFIFIKYNYSSIKKIKIKIKTVVMFLCHKSQLVQSSLFDLSSHLTFFFLLQVFRPRWIFYLLSSVCMQFLYLNKQAIYLIINDKIFSLLKLNFIKCSILSCHFGDSQFSTSLIFLVLTIIVVV